MSDYKELIDRLRLYGEQAADDDSSLYLEETVEWEAAEAIEKLVEKTDTIQANSIPKAEIVSVVEEEDEDYVEEDIIQTVKNIIASKNRIKQSLAEYRNSEYCKLAEDTAHLINLIQNNDRLMITASDELIDTIDAIRSILYRFDIGLGRTFGTGKRLKRPIAPPIGLRDYPVDGVDVTYDLDKQEYILKEKE